MEKGDNLQIKVAFFKGDTESRLHRFIRWWTKSPYSHAELVMPDGKTWVSISPFLSSRVASRIKMDPNPRDWDYLVFDLSWREPVRDYQLEQLYRFIEETQGSKYDWIGMIMSHISSYVVKKKQRWYCSEWIAHALVYARIVKWNDMNLYDIPDLNPAKLHSKLLEFKAKNNCTKA